MIPAISMRIRCGCEGGGKGPLLQIEKSGTLATGNDQYLFAPKDAEEILNDQGGDSISVEKGGVSPTLRSQTYGNLPITAYAIQGSMIGGESGPHAVTASGCMVQFPPDAMVGINGNLAGTLLSSYYKGTGMRCGRERDVVLCASSGQSHAEILQELSPTLNCASEQPYVVRPDDSGQEQPIVPHPQIAGMFCASGGYLLNYQNPVRTGLCVRRLTPTEAERLQGYPDGWTEAGADGNPISDTKRYQMLGNSIAVPCVAYIMQGITDAVNQACEKGGKKL